MSSIRIPPDLLAQLHQAAPPGVSLAQLVAGLLEDGGGPAAVRARLEQKGRRVLNRLQIERLRRAGHPSMVLEPGHQEGLALVAAGWVRALEQEGERSREPRKRVLHLKHGRLVPPSRGSDRKFTMRRSGLG